MCFSSLSYLEITGPLDIIAQVNEIPRSFKVFTIYYHFTIVQMYLKLKKPKKEKKATKNPLS